MNITKNTIFIIFLFWISPAFGECIIKEGLPDFACSPGDVFPEATPEQICVPGYSKTVRNTPQSLKDEVYRTYDMNPKQPPCPCMVDHIIPLQIGGSNDIKNLFPQPSTGPLNSKRKDKLENYLKREICRGHISMEQAQQEIGTDWVSAYYKYGLDKKTKVFDKFLPEVE